MIYQHPLAYLLGLEGIALLRGWAGDFDQEFVEARLAEVRRLLAADALANHDGVMVERGDTLTGYRRWAATYGLAILLALYTEYSALFALAPQLLLLTYLFVARRERSRERRHHSPFWRPRTSRAQPQRRARVGGGDSGRKSRRRPRRTPSPLP